MAGTFTHFMVCDVAKAARGALPADLRKLLNRHSEFLFLGAVSPDLPRPAPAVLPGDQATHWRNGSFRESGFNRAVTNVIAAWNALYTALAANIAIASIVRDCNLDTGVDMDSRGGVVPYWVG